MGKGAFITFVNNTDLTLNFNNTDRERCWKDDTLDRVHGSIAPNGQSERFYIEGSSSVFSACKGVSASVKFNLSASAKGTEHKASVQILQDGSKFLEREHQVMNLQANSVIEQGEQDDITVYITKPYNRQRWITGLADTSKSITELNIPGTHDTGTFAKLVADLDGIRGDLPINKNTFSQCQEYDITQQLQQGIRFLDIRLSSLDNIKNGVSGWNVMGHAIKLATANHESTALFIVHDKMLYEYTFSQVLAACKKFLSDNPGEFIVMSVKPDGFGFKDKLWEQYDSDPIFYDGCQYPTVAQAKGKIVLLRRFGGDKFRGFELDVPDNRISGVQSHKHKGCNTEYRYVTQDQYDIDLEQTYKKQGTVNDFLNTYTQDTSGLLLLNFISYVGKYYGLPYPRDAARHMNPWLYKELLKRGKGKYGTVIMDFPPQPLIDSIIRSNS